MKILTIGATGLLGRAFKGRWGEEEVIELSSRDLDIRDWMATRTMLGRERPHWTLLLAGYTDVDGCERDPDHAESVNVNGAGNVARAANEVGSRLVFVSTDYVFDGLKTSPYQPGDPVRPINIYGKSKAAGEELVRRANADFLIVRTSWLYGVGAPCFPETILGRAPYATELSVVSDQRGTPTYAPDLAQAIVRLVRGNAHGTLHFSNSGECTWHEFAQAILKGAGFGKVKLRPATSSEVPRPARRPAYSVLSKVGLEQYGVHVRPWQAGLFDFLKERAATVAAAGKK